MFKWLKSLFSPPKPAGPPRSIRSFNPSDQPIRRDIVSPDDNGWRIEVSENQSIGLFEVPEPGCEKCLLTYRARIKSENLQGLAYLEMWRRLPGRGEFFSKGLNQPVKGATDWAAYEIQFYLKEGRRPDLIKLNLHLEGVGTVWIKEIELLETPLA